MLSSADSLVGAILGQDPNTSANEVKAACADYLGITEMSSSSSFTDDASGGDERVLTQIKAPLLKRGAGAMSTKRHRSSVEVAVKGAIMEQVAKEQLASSVSILGIQSRTVKEPLKLVTG